MTDDLAKPAPDAHPRTPEATHMFREAAESARVVAAQLAMNRDRVGRLGETLRQMKPRAVITFARGSSDHAATFAKYLIETKAGILTSSAAPSVSSVYASSLEVRGALCLAISQSGKSPDLLAAVEAAKNKGAYVVVLVNAAGSPLEKIADVTIPLSAGFELSVAATKSYICALAAITHLIASWTENGGLLNAIEYLPTQLDAAWKLDWSAAIDVLRPARNLYVIGRGIGFGAVQEAALKLKETCGLHAEAFSTAEIQHGPMALVKQGFPLLAFAQGDETQAGVRQLASDLAARGANILLAGTKAAGTTFLPSVASHPVLEPILMIQSFYRMAAALSVARGFDPDRPPHLNKVTRTI